MHVGHWLIILFACFYSLLRNITFTQFSIISVPITIKNLWECINIIIYDQYSIHSKVPAVNSNIILSRTILREDKINAPMKIDNVGCQKLLIFDQISRFLVRFLDFWSELLIFCQISPFLVRFFNVGCQVLTIKLIKAWPKIKLAIFRETFILSQLVRLFCPLLFY